MRRATQVVCFLLSDLSPPLFSKARERTPPPPAHTHAHNTEHHNSMDIRNFFGAKGAKKVKKVKKTKKKSSPGRGGEVLDLVDDAVAVDLTETATTTTKASSTGASSSGKLTGIKRSVSQGLVRSSPSAASSSSSSSSSSSTNAAANSNSSPNMGGRRKAAKTSPAKSQPSAAARGKAAAAAAAAAGRGGRRWYGSREPEASKLAGASDVPQGSPGCLEGLTFVMTGVGKRMSREEFTDLVMGYGGKVTTAVSSKTDYLVVGEVLEDGRQVEEGSKHRRATELLEAKQEASGKSPAARAKIRAIITEGQLFDLVRDRTANPPPTVVPKKGTAAAKPALSDEQRKRLEANRLKALARKAAREAAARAKQAPSSSGAVDVASIYSNAGKKPPVASFSAASSASNGHAGAWATHLDGSNSLWAEMFRPGCMDDLIGNVGSATKVRNWLSSWHQRFGVRLRAINGQRVVLCLRPN